MLLSCLMQGVELPSAVASHEVEQDIRDREEEIHKLTSLHRAKETEGKERGRDEEEWEESDLRARLEEAEDRRIRAEEEPKNQQSRAAEMDEKVHNYLSAEWCPESDYNHSEVTTSVVLEVESVR